MGVKESINTENIKNKYLIEMWNSVIPSLKLNHIHDVKILNSVDCYKYRYDLSTLLKLKYSVREEFIVPTLLVNNYKSDQDFDGTNNKIILIDDITLNRYYLLFIKHMETLTQDR